MNKLIAESLGTFALVFAGTGAIVIDQVSGGTVTHVGVALTFGLIVLAMIYGIIPLAYVILELTLLVGFRMMRHGKQLALLAVYPVQQLFLMGQFLLKRFFINSKPIKQSKRLTLTFLPQIHHKRADFMNLKEAREKAKMDQFIREREKQPPAERNRFQKLIKLAASKTVKPKQGTSRKGSRGN